jgi:DNA-binding response OmpR family regulator
MKGYEVLEADSGAAALRIAASQTGRIDLVITDMILPGMSGQELAKRLTERYPTARILFVSGYTEEAIIHQGMLDEGTAFLQKPFRLRELAQKVRQVLNSAAPAR